MPTILLAALAALLLQFPSQPTAPPSQEQIQRIFTATEAATQQWAARMRNEKIAGISLDRDGSSRHGIVLDHALMTLASARLAAKAGPMTAVAEPSPSGPDAFANMGPRDIAVIAYPAQCGGHAVSAESIDLSVAGGPMAGPARKTSEFLKGDAVARRFLGFPAPEGSAAQLFPSLPLSSSTVTIKYGAECTGNEAEVSFTFQMTPGLPLARLPQQKLPADAKEIPWPVNVRVSGLVDHTGTIISPTVIDGPAPLEAASVTAVSSMRYKPYAINATPSTQNVSVFVTFVGDGAPTAPTQPRASDGPSPMTSSFVPGRPATNEMPDAPGLTAATSMCPISADAQYGKGADAPIKTGGGVFVGANRQLTYLRSLRGPNGEGIRFRRLGSTPAPDKDRTILDMYEVTYPGLAQAIRLYVDAYHFEELKAPAGFACPAAFTLKEPEKK